MSRGCRGALCLLLCLVLSGCAASPAASSTPAMLTPLDAGQIAEISALDPKDVAALEVFFGRWGAYTATVGIEAQDAQDVYSDLYAFEANWERAVTLDALDGGCQVKLFLPATPGLLEVDAEGGRIRTASVSYDSEDAEVRASLAFTVACNALIYALADDDDMNAVASVYNECMKRLHESGAEMAGIAEQDGYTFTLSLTAGDQNMNFAAMLSDP